MGLREMESRLPPGFRFYPSDEELVCFYLRKKVANERVASGTLVEVDLHAREPWELPEVAKLTADEWYFFSFRDRKYATGTRTNRATKTGYWKATGKDRVVRETATTRAATAGTRKTLVFYRGRAPNGHNTGWVMHEFRLETPNSPPKEDWVLCRVFNKRKASKAEQGSNSNHADFTAGTGAAGPSSPTALLGSSPDPTVRDKFDHHQIATAMTGSGSSTPVLLMNGDHHMGSHCSSSSSSALLNLAMLQYSFLEYCPGVHDDMAVAGAEANNTSCCAGSNSSDAMMELELELGQHMGFEEHGMGKIIEMEMEPQGGGNCYNDGLYF